MKHIRIGKKVIGPNSPVFIIAEAGANSNSNFEMAKQLVIKAKEAGADCIKFQSYTAENIVTKTAPKYYVDTMQEWKKNVELHGFQYDEFKLLDKMPAEKYKELIDLCNRIKIIFLSTPFDEEFVDLLDEIGIPAFKVASADITYLNFLKYIAKKGKPIILSTGASNLSEVKEAVDVIRSEGNDQIVLLHCTLSYPCHYRDLNLRMMQTLAKTFPDIPVGLSDHSLGSVAPVVATTLGAKLIEKHYTLDKSLPYSTDHFMSIDPPGLKEMVTMIRNAESSLGKKKKQSIKVEEKSVLYARRSAIAKRDLASGKILQEEDIIIKRPGTGILPNKIYNFIGKRIKRDIPADTVLQKDMFSGRKKQG